DSRTSVLTSKFSVLSSESFPRSRQGGGDASFLDRTDVVDDAPDLVVLQLVLEGHHVEVGGHADLDVREDLAVGRAVSPGIAEEARRRRNQVVAGAALAVASVAGRAVSLVQLLPRRDRFRRRGHRVLQLRRVGIALRGNEAADTRAHENGERQPDIHGGHGSIVFGKVSAMKTHLLAAVVIAGLFNIAAAPAAAQLAAPNAAGVSLGHLHVNASDVDAQVRFWTAVGGKLVQREKLTMMQFPGVYVLIRKQDSSGGTDGSSVNHIGFSVRDFDGSVAKWKAAGLTWEPGRPSPDGQGFLVAPDKIRVEIFENRSQPAPMMMNHVHLQVTDIPQ